MNKINKYISLLLLIFNISHVLAEDLTNKSIYLDETGELKQLADSLAHCGGVYKAYSEFLEASNPATAENLKGQSNGAKSSAMFLITKLNMAKDGLPRKYGEATPYVDAIGYGYYTQTASLLEIGDIKEANKQLEACVAISEVQAEIVKMMREEIY